MRTFVAMAIAIAALCALPAQAADNLVPGKTLLIKPGRLTKFIAKPVSPALFPLPGAGNAPTAKPWSGWEWRAGMWGHAELNAVNGWSGLGNPPGSKGYKYRGAGSLADPCKVVLIKAKIIKAVCSGNLLPGDPPYANPIRFQIGADDLSDRYCAEFGGTVLKNSPAGYKSKDAPPPSVCASPSGAFLDDPGLL